MTLTPSIIKLSLFLSFMVTSIYPDTGSLAYPRPLITCERLHEHQRSYTQARLALEHEGILNVASSLRTSRWIPRSPQLRGRVNHDQRRGQAGEWSGRVGTRLYLPALTTDPPESVELGVSLRDLPDAWLKAYQQREALRVAELHIVAREAWVALRVAQELDALYEARQQISQNLERAGAVSTRSLKHARLKHELAKLERDQTLGRWVSAVSLIEDMMLKDQQSPRIDPLESACVTRPTTESAWDQLIQQPRILSAQEAELLLELNQQHTAHVRRRGRWLDFVEVSYDQQGDDTRWIAEVGVDLVSLDPRGSSEELELHQLRSALRERSDEARRAESRLRAQIQLIRAHTTPSLTLDRPALTQLPEIELYELEVKLWQRLWLRDLSSERTLIQWRVTHRAD